MTKKNRIRVLAALAVLVLGSAGGVLAKYRSEQVKQAEMIAADFHFSSNYLEEDGATHSVSNWNEGITLELYNYEKENPALVSALDVDYTVTVSEGFTIDSPTGTLKTGSPQTATVTITPKADTAVDELTVTVTTTPYNEGLSATFQLVGQQKPTLKVIGDSTDTHYTVQVYANHFEGEVTLEWTEGLIPDATNDLVTASWDGTFDVEPFHTYEILFFNPSSIDGEITLK